MRIDEKVECPICKGTGVYFEGSEAGSSSMHSEKFRCGNFHFFKNISITVEGKTQVETKVAELVPAPPGYLSCVGGELFMPDWWNE